MKRFMTALFAIIVASTFTMSAHAQKLNQVLNEDEASLKSYFEKEKLNPIEGVYKNFNGSYYRLGIKKMGDRLSLKIANLSVHLCLEVFGCI
jgi:hypothetical protein